MTEPIPLPTVATQSRLRTEDDGRIVACLVAALAEHGVVLPDFIQQKVEEAATQWRVTQVEQLGACYLAVSLHAGHLHSLLRRLKIFAQPHPHGNTPRILVYQEEFDAVMMAAGNGNDFISPALREAERLNQEIQVLMASRKEADSARAALQRIAEDLRGALESHELIRASEVLEAAGVAHDLACTELRRRPEVGSLYPSESELGSAYMPIVVEEFAQLRNGDVIFEPLAKMVIYQHGNPRDAEIAAPAPEEFLKKMVGHVCLRPMGAQAVLSLRWRQTVQRLKIMAEAETKLGKPIQVGRAQGMRMAHEWLSLPSWTLPPIRLKAVEKEKAPAE